MKFWSARKLLIAKALTLDESLTKARTTPKSFYFSNLYPRTSEYNNSEAYRVVRTLMGLQSQGLIKLSDYKISKDYIKFYDNLEVERKDDLLAKWAQSERYGLRPRALHAVEDDEPVDRRDLVLMLIGQKEVRLVDEEGEGPTTLYQDRHPALMYPLYICQHLSFQVSLPAPKKLRKEIDDYINAYKEGRLQETTLYFGYQLQKSVLLDTIKSIHDKQTSRRIVVRIGTAKSVKQLENLKDLDEFTKTFHDRYKQYFDISDLADMNSPHSYYVKPFETLLALALDGYFALQRIKPFHVPIIDQSSRIYPKGYSLTDFSLELKAPFFKVFESTNDATEAAAEEEKTEVPEQRILKFFEKDGTAVYQDAVYQFKPGSKAYAFLRFLESGKNTPWTLAEIADKCNHKIVRKDRKFKTQKDLRDTVAYIQEKLSVSKGEYFPIQKIGNEVKWVVR